PPALSPAAPSAGGRTSVSAATARTAPGVTVPVADGRAGSDALDAPRWASGPFSGVQAAPLSVLGVAVPALTAYGAASADAAHAHVLWPRAVAVGAALWLLGHGAILQVGDAVVTVVPLGITLLSMFACWASARRSARPSLSAWGAGIGGYAAVVILTVLLTGPVG